MTTLATPQGPGPLLSVRDLHVSFGASAVVRGVSFDIAPGECLAIVGESGSGKSVTARSLIGLAGHSARVDAGVLELRTGSGQPTSLLDARPSQWRRIRGRDIGLVLQDALVSLDPLRPVGREIDDALRLHTKLSTAERRQRVQELLLAVGMPEPAQRARQRPGELSGGLRQRALIASAIALNPPLLIADEPTTALDVTVQAQILDLLAGLKEAGTALLLISHDLAVVRQVADRVAVMRSGMILEQGATSSVLESPTHDYTRALLAAVPSRDNRGQRLSAEPPRRLAVASREKPVIPLGYGTVAHEPVLEANGLVKAFRRPDGQHVKAVDDVSLELLPGRTLGLVGESGSGKTTVARLVLGLLEPDAGAVTLEGQPWNPLAERGRRSRRGAMGAVYQDTLSSFDPRLTVGDILADAAGRSDAGDASAGRVMELLDWVGLASNVLGRRPLHLSGGQRQRVSIARALAPSPRIIICDEPVSALDVSVQAQVLDLLSDLQRELGVSYLFISHDLGVVAHMSDAVAVMQNGRIVESGSRGKLFGSPQHDYTRELLAAAPRL